MINPADLKRMQERAHATVESAQKTDAHHEESDLIRSSGASNTPKPQLSRDHEQNREHSSESEHEHKSAHETSHEHPRVTPAIMRQQIEMAYSSHYSSGYFMDDEEYRAEYDLELTNEGETFSHFSSISSSIVPLYSTSTLHDETALDERDKDRLRSLLELDNDSAALDSTVHTQEESTSTPTPAIMAKKREEGPLTFASLDNHDLPVVREYSAGGLIFDENDRVAIITRHSRSGHIEWCLPKGHIEKGETSEETAVREIFEETGIKGEVIDSIATIDYWFTGDAQRIHKLVHHYALRMTGGYLTVEGDPDHEAEDATWVKFKDLTDVLSYPNERRIVWLYAKKRRREA